MLRRRALLISSQEEALVGSVISLADRVREGSVASSAAQRVVSRAEELANVRSLGETGDEYRVSLQSSHPEGTVATYGRRVKFLEDYVGRDCPLQEIEIGGLEAMVADYREAHCDNTTYSSARRSADSSSGACADATWSTRRPRRYAAHAALTPTHGG